MYDDDIDEYPIIHPLRPFNYKPETVDIVSGDGIYVKDTNGKRYIDAISGLWNVTLGYNNKNINNAIIEQLNKIPFINLYDNGNPTTLDFARRLLHTLPDELNKVIYTCSGSESNEAAIKLARKYYRLIGKPQKRFFAVLDLSYHGTTYGAMSASGMDRSSIDEYGPCLDGFYLLDTPFCTCCETNNMSDECKKKSTNSIEELFRTKGDQLAGIILEPVIGSGGIIPLPNWYIQKVKELCKEYNVLIIFDEVATGFGRTGCLFAFEQYDIIPDMICLSKGINSGYLPMGAVVFSTRIYDIFSNNNSYIEHFSTQNGNPLACAAGLATLDIVDDKLMMDRVKNLGNLLLAKLKENLLDNKNVVSVRGRGLMVGVQLKGATNICLTSDQLFKLCQKIRNKGLIVYPFYIYPKISGFSLFPSFISTENDILRIANIFCTEIQHFRFM